MSNFDDDDELVDVPSIPRWLRSAAWSMAVVLAGVLAGVMVSRHHGGPTAGPRPSPLVESSRVANPPVPTRAAVAVAGDVWWEVQGTTLYAESAGGAPRFARAITLPRAFASPLGKPRLAVDPVTGGVWVVLEEDRSSRMVEVPAGSARIVRDVRWRTAAYGAAAYAGHLYLSTGLGIADLAPRAARPRLVPGLAGAVGPVVADPSRHRLIAIDFGYPTSLWSFGPHSAPAEAPGTLPLSEATMAVVRGAIWILGRAGGRAVLDRLDPKTLRPTTRMRLSAQLSAGAVLLSAGDRTLWLAGPLGELVCADSGTGVSRRTWQIPGVDAVAAGRRTALISTPGGVRKIYLGACRA